MKKYVKSSSDSALLYFEAYQLDNIGELVADNLTHKYRSEGADFYYVGGQQGYDYKTGKNSVTVRCRVSSHYDAEINKNSRYGAYLDSLDGKEFTARYEFGYNRYDTQDTMGRQVVIALTDDIEDQIIKGSGVMGACDVKASTCDKVTGATDITDEQVKFFYEHKFLGACDPENMHCDKLLDLMKSNKAVASEVLEYMNSLGDPVFPKEGTDYEAETEVDNVDIDELYSVFMQELGYDYEDTKGMGYDFYVGGSYLLPGFEIFDGAVSEGVDLSASTKVNATSEPNADVMKLVNQFFKEAKELVEYFSSHNKNLNRRQDELIENLSDAIDSRSTSAAREAIENLKYNTKRMNNEQSYKVEELYDELCCAGGKYQGLGRSYKEDSVTGSTKYGADMCSIGASEDEDGYEQLAELDDGPHYSIIGYFDNTRSPWDSSEGSCDTNDFDEIVTLAKKYIGWGDFVKITNNETSRSYTYSPDEWYNEAGDNDVPTSIYDLE